MIFIPNEDNWEPAMRYEGLARHAYDCGRAGDPEGISDASVFDRECIPTMTERGHEIMTGILDQLIQKHGVISETLNTVKGSLNVGMDQDRCIELIDYIIYEIKNQAV